jgi:predicted nucleic acid-binding protein
LNIFVDTSVWSLALRRDAPPDLPEVNELRRSLDNGTVYCTGLVLQELLQGFSKPKAHRQIISHFSALPLLVPDRDDHVHAAELRNRCRRKGVQAGTIDGSPQTKTFETWHRSLHCLFGILLPIEQPSLLAIEDQYSSRR